MKTVNLYIASSIRGPARRDGQYMYILETDTAKGVATLTAKKALSGTTENQATIYALCSALSRLREPCHLEIYTDCVYLATAMTQGWLMDWKYAGWQNKRGRPVKDAEKWQEISYFLDVHDFHVHLKEFHTYKTWMNREINMNNQYA